MEAKKRNLRKPLPAGGGGRRERKRWEGRRRRPWKVNKNKRQKRRRGGGMEAGGRPASCKSSPRLIAQRRLIPRTLSSRPPSKSSSFSGPGFRHMNERRAGPILRKHHSLELPGIKCEEFCLNPVDIDCFSLKFDEIL